MNGCHSYILGKIFSEYVQSVICIHLYAKTLDRTANKKISFSQIQMILSVHLHPIT